MTRRTARRQSSRPRREETEAVTVYTIEEAVNEAVQVFAPADAACFLGNAYCPLSDLIGWIATLPAARTARRRYVIGIGNITENATGEIASHYATVEMIAPEADLLPYGEARVRRGEITFLFAVQSLDFLRAAPGWETMRRVRPALLGEDGLEFEDS